MIIAFALVFLFINYQLTKSKKANAAWVDFEVTRGQEVKEIARNLEQAGLIHSAWWFESEVWLRGNEKSFLSGSYKLNPVWSIRKIVKFMTETEPAPNEVKITLIEGWRRQEMADYLFSLGLAESSQELIDLTSDNRIYKDVWDFLVDSPSGASLEGFLFPDTYRVFKKAETSDIINKLLKNFDRQLTLELRQAIEKQNKTIYEVITLASIVQKEVKSEADMAVVAGVFTNRLRLDMPLQSDATITYLTGKKDPSPSTDDLDFSSLYNTYLYKGLPPGPIASPGKAAITAVVQPAETDYLYFLTTPEGQTIFSKTLGEHNQNKIKYLK